MPPSNWIPLSDVYPWERFYFERLPLASWFEFEAARIWCGRNWPSALAETSGATRYVSVLGSNRFKSVSRRQVPSDVQFVAHSPYASRFLTELEQIPVHQVLQVVLPACPPDLFPKPARNTAAHYDFSPKVVGTLAPFEVGENLHTFFSIAHYVVNRQPDVKFQLIGFGDQADHYRRIAKDLGLENSVQIVSVEKFTLETLIDLDVFLFLPLQIFHPIPLHLAAAMELPVIGWEFGTADSLLRDGSDSFTVGVNDIKPFGELVLRLLGDDRLRQSLGQAFSKNLLTRFPPSGHGRREADALKVAS